MKLQVNGVDSPINSLVFLEDLTQYYSVVVFTTTYFIYTKEVLLVHDKTYDLVILRSELEDGMYKNVAVSKKTYDLLNSVCEPFCGTATVRSLVTQRLGLNFKSSYDSVATFWMIPKLKLINVIKELNKYTKVGNGGGSHFYINLDGDITFTDYYREFSLGTPLNLVGTVLSDKVVTDWVAEIPSEIDVYSSDINGLKKQVQTIYQKYGKASAFITDTTGELTEMRKHMLVNDFYNRFFTSRRISVELPALTDLYLGKVYSVNKNGKFIMANYSVAYNFGNSVPQVSVNLITCPR